ncbi:MAG: hypothetical protein JNL87_01330 [Burkholderiaceae bacterium]|nr:hypothetical protein [Burkholderiaceae bacterium]
MASKIVRRAKAAFTPTKAEIHRFGATSVRASFPHPGVLHVQFYGLLTIGSLLELRRRVIHLCDEARVIAADYRGAVMLMTDQQLWDALHGPKCANPVMLPTCLVVDASTRHLADRVAIQATVMQGRSMTVMVDPRRALAWASDTARLAPRSRMPIQSTSNQ